MKRRKNISTFICLLCISLSVPLKGFAKNMIGIETGNYQSASWQFTELLSELWEKNHPETESGFVPDYTENIEERFARLIRENCRFVIAPLDELANQTMLNGSVKLVTLLWTVHLLPVDLGSQKEKINLDNYRYWYVPSNSAIVPKLMNLLGKGYFAEDFRERFQLQHVNQGIIIETNTSPIESQTKSFENQSFKEEIISLDESLPTLVNNLLNGDNLAYQKSAEIAGLSNFDADVLEVSTEIIPEALETYKRGIFFYEIMGSINDLRKAVDSPVSTVSLNRNIREFLISVHPWIQPLYNSRAGIHTLEFSMALYVNKTEDAEFIEDIIKLLSERPRSYFPQSFIFSNLKIQKTREISPLFLHAGSLKFFGLD